MAYSKEIKQKVLSLKKEWLKTIDIKSAIDNMFWVDITDQSIRNFIREWDFSDLNNNTESKKRFDISNWYYIFYKNRRNEYWDIEKEQYPILVSTIDSIFHSYSRKGKDMSGESIMNKFKIKPEVWHMIKSRLWLMKDSNIVSQYTLDKIPEKSLWEYLEGKMQENIQDRYKDIFVKKDKAVRKREFKKYSTFFYSNEALLESIKRSIKKYEPKAVSVWWIPRPKNNDTIDIAFSDLHIWKQNTQAILDRLSAMVDYIWNTKEKNINLVFLWDLAETLVEWWMHSWQVESLELNWFPLIMNVVETLQAVLLELRKRWKVVNFYWLWWNHDRLWKNHQEDQARTWALIIYELIRRWLSNYDIWVHTISDKTSTLYLDNFNIVVNHWDEWFDKKAQLRAEKVLRDNVEKNWKYNIILYWDKHNVKINEWSWYTSVWLPALAWQWTYDKRLDLHSEAWYIVLEKNSSNTADVLIKRL